MIFYGYYFSVIKTVQGRDVSIDNVIFKRRVKIAHLFWIPLFPMGFDWIMEKANGEESAVDNVMFQKLNSKAGVARSPWYAYGGPLAFIAWIVFSIVGGIIDDSTNDRRMSDSNNGRIKKMEEKINNPTIDDYYDIKGEEWSNIIKVNKTTLDSVEFLIPSDNKRLGAHRDSTIVKFFATSDSLIYRQKFAKNDLKELIKKDFHDKGKSDKALGIGQVRIDGIKRIIK